jgi:uncharacterized protein (DUF488 family)
MHTISTIGYEGAHIDAFVYTLGVAGINCVLDIRDVAASRRPGFSKNALQQHLSLAGIEYIHLRGLGDPKDGREAMRRGDYSEFQRIFLDRLAGEPAQSQLARAITLAAERSVALLCYERDPRYCHRKMVAEKMKEQGSFAIRHLGVQLPRRIADARAIEGEFVRVR